MQSRARPGWTSTDRRSRYSAVPWANFATLRCLSRVEFEQRLCIFLHMCLLRYVTWLLKWETNDKRIRVALGRSSSIPHVQPENYDDCNNVRDGGSDSFDAQLHLGQAGQRMQQHFWNHLSRNMRAVTVGGGAEDERRHGGLLLRCNETDEGGLDISIAEKVQMQSVWSGDST